MMENIGIKQAAGDGSLDLVRQLLENGCSINDADSRGITPLMAAARSGHSDIVEFLCVSGADVNQKTGNGETALYNACSSVNLEATEVLLKYGADVNIQTNDLHPQTGRSPLMAAVPSNYALTTRERKKSDALKIIRSLISRGCNLNAQDWTGSTALHMASERGDVHTVCLLADSGTDLRMRNNQGLTAFEYAVQPDKQRYDIAFILLLYGYDIEDSKGPTHPLISVIQGITHEEAKYFTSAKVHRKRLFKALLEVVHWKSQLANGVERLLTNIPKENDDLQFIQSFFEIIRPETLQSICRRTVRRTLQQSVFRGIRELHVAKSIKTFLALNYDIEGHNPLSVLDLNLAVEEQDTGLIQKTLQTGIDVNFSLNDHLPLTEAVLSGDLDLCKLLMKYGASPQKPDSCGLNSLHWAVTKGHLHIIQELMSRGVDIHKTDCSLKENYVIMAAKFGHFNVMNYLLKQGGDPKIPSTDGIYPIHYAAGSGNVQAVRELLLNNVSPDTCDCYNNTPLHVAASRGLLYTRKNIRLPALFVDEVSMNMDGIRNNLGLEPDLKYFLTSDSIDHAGVIKVLIESAAERLPVNSNNMTPIDVAAFFKLDDVALLLKTIS